MLFVMNSTAHKKYEINVFDQLMCFVTIQDGHIDTIRVQEMENA